jgi:prepilin-type N-terminal cleavage/methylation domain-containing protein
MRRAGFSFLELVVVLAILTILSALATPALELVTVKARERQLRERLQEMRRAIDKYRAARNTTGASQLPPSLQALLDPVTADLLKIGADAGPFLASSSLGNPFAGSTDRFLWDIRDGAGVWHLNEQNPAAAVGVYDVRYPVDGVGGWKKALDDTNLSDW